MTSMMMPSVRGVAVGTLAKGSGVIVGVEVMVGVTGVEVGVGSCCKKGRTTGGLVRMVRLVRVKIRARYIFDGTIPLQWKCVPSSLLTTHFFVHCSLLIINCFLVGVDEIMWETGWQME